LRPHRAADNRGWSTARKIGIEPMTTHILSLEAINKGFDPMHARESIRSVVVF